MTAWAAPAEWPAQVAAAALADDGSGRSSTEFCNKYLKRIVAIGSDEDRLVSGASDLHLVASDYCIDAHVGAALDKHAHIVLQAIA